MYTDGRYWHLCVWRIMASQYVHGIPVCTCSYGIPVCTQMVGTGICVYEEREEHGESYIVFTDAMDSHLSAWRIEHSFYRYHVLASMYMKNITHCVIKNMFCWYGEHIVYTHTQALRTWKIEHSVYDVIVFTQVVCIGISVYDEYEEHEDYISSISRRHVLASVYMKNICIHEKDNVVYWRTNI